MSPVTENASAQNPAVNAIRISVASPVYNEADTIEKTVRGWVRFLDALDVPSEIILCNDGSRDGTGDILARLSAEFPNVRDVGEPDINRGYGYAISLAIRECRGDYIITIDSDGQFQLEDLAEIINSLGDGAPDGFAGYRVRKQDSFLRVAADRCLNLIVRMLFFVSMRDTNCALKMIRRELLQKLRLESNGYPFPTEVCIKLHALGAQLAEFPVHHLERSGGQSKLKLWRTGFHMLWFLVYLRMRLWVWRRKLIREL